MRSLDHFWIFNGDVLVYKTEKLRTDLRNLSCYYYISWLPQSLPVEYNYKYRAVPNSQDESSKSFVKNLYGKTAAKWSHFDSSLHQDIKNSQL